MKGNSSPKVLREEVLDPFCLILIKEIPDLVGLHLISSQTWLPPVNASATGIILPLSLYSYLPAQCLAHTRDSICLLNLLRLALSLALIILFFIFPDFSYSLLFSSFFFCFFLFVCSPFSSSAQLLLKEDKVGNWSMNKVNSSRLFFCLPSLLFLFSSSPCTLRVSLSAFQVL